MDIMSAAVNGCGRTNAPCPLCCLARRFPAANARQGASHGNAEFFCDLPDFRNHREVVRGSGRILIDRNSLQINLCFDGVRNYRIPFGFLCDNALDHRVNLSRQINHLSENFKILASPERWAVLRLILFKYNISSISFPFIFVTTFHRYLPRLLKILPCVSASTR